MLYLETFGAAVLIDFPEPFPDPGVEFHHGAETAETLPGQVDSRGAGLVDHGLHVAEYFAGVVVLRELVASAPEEGGILAESLYQSEFLHVGRGEGAVEVVDEGYCRSCHSVLLEYLRSQISKIFHFSVCL